MGLLIYKASFCLCSLFCLCRWVCHLKMSTAHKHTHLNMLAWHQQAKHGPKVLTHFSLTPIRPHCLWTTTQWMEDLVLAVEVGGPPPLLFPFGSYCLAGPLPCLRPILDLLTQKQPTAKVTLFPLLVKGRKGTILVSDFSFPMSYWDSSGGLPKFCEELGEIIEVQC